MFNADEAATVSEVGTGEAPEQGETSRRDFLRQMAAAGAGVAALTLLNAEQATATPSAPALIGRYLVNHNFGLNYLGIESQSGNSFSGRFDDGTHVAGCIVGAHLVMSRALPDGSNAYYVGTASARPAPNGRDILFAGTFYKGDGGPLPWFGTGNIRG
jgi:hypothetical protein